MNDFKPIIAEHSDQLPLFVAGPCSAENREQVLETARQLQKAGIKVFRAGIWKPRTQPGGFEGVGSKGLAWLDEVRETTGMKVATEVATRVHVEEALAHNVDILWIGARTSANPFAVQEIADAIQRSGKDVAVLVKNPVNPDLELWIGAIRRIYNAGIHRLGAIHRGFSSYGEHTYRNVPIWRIPLELARRVPGLPILTDPSHIGGKREFIAPLSRQAMDMGFAGLFVESHLAPDSALSDKDQQISPDELSRIIGSLEHNTTNRPSENLSAMRNEIDRLDAELIDILSRRMNVALQIAKTKKELGMSILQTSRYDEIVKNCVDMGAGMGLDPEFVRSLVAAIHEESVKQQLCVYNSLKTD